MKIIIVEDDCGLNNGIAFALKSQGHQVMQCFNISQAKEAHDGDLFILDVNLPDGNGFDFLKELRQKSDIPVIMLTANDLETDEVMGLTLGADDYITKPFSLMVLRVRIEKILKKSRAKEAQIFTAGTLYADFDSLKFTVSGRETEFSKTEIKLLKLFLSNKEKTLTRDHLVDRIWTDGAEYVDENALSVTVNRLRKKLEDNGAFIQTVYGLGYCWKEE